VVVDATICLFSINYWFDLSKNVMKRLIIPLNIGIEILISFTLFLVIEILKDIKFSVMAALICILCPLAMDNRVGSKQILKKHASEV
jgi:hypothetical protein